MDGKGKLPHISVFIENMSCPFKYAYIHITRTLRLKINLILISKGIIALANNFLSQLAFYFKYLVFLAMRKIKIIDFSDD